MNNDHTIRVRRPAMGCEFELVLCGDKRDLLLSAAEEAFEEVRRIEEQLSIFIPTSEISCINASAAFEPVCVEPRLFGFLKTCERLYRETDGAFDVTAGALVSLWESAEGTAPSPEEIADVLAFTGMEHVVLDEDTRTVRFAKPEIKLDLGGIGKGYAAQQVVEVLGDFGIESALIAAGASSVYGLGTPPGDEAWMVGIRDPVNRDARIASVRLRNQGLSTSGSHERFVEIDGVRYSHIIDPRTGCPASGLLLACAVTGSPVDGDALSTAFFIQGIEWAKGYCDSHDDAGAVFVTEESSGETPVVHRIGVIAEH